MATKNVDLTLIIDISEKLDSFFKEKNLTSYKVAQITGISDVSIGRYRSGKSKPTESKMNILFDHFSDLKAYLIDQKSALKQKKYTLVEDNEDIKNDVHEYKYKKAEFEIILDQMSADEIIGYVYKYEKEKFANNETYKKFIKIKQDKAIIKYIEKELNEE